MTGYQEQVDADRPKRPVTKVYATALVEGLIARARAVQGVEHGGTKGLLREAFVDGLLRHFMTPRFGTGTGHVINAKGDVSPQTDIIIYDACLLPPLLGGERSDLFPCESVVAVIEVKSVLNKAEFEGSCENAQAIQRLAREGETERILSFLFAFDLNGLPDLANDDPGRSFLQGKEEYLNGLCVAGKFSWMFVVQEIVGGTKRYGWNFHHADVYREEVKRFTAILLDNVRSCGERRYRHATSGHRDWIGAYIRDQD